MPTFGTRPPLHQAIADLQVQIAPIQNRRGELASQIRQRVVTEMLDLDTSRRAFQIGQEVARWESLRLKVLEVDDRFGRDDSKGVRSAEGADVSGVGQGEDAD